MQSERLIYSSRYLTMRDGVRIAVDLYLPAALRGGEKLPTILQQTRYFRSMELRWPYRLFLGGRPLDHTGLYAKRRKRFVSNGYAWVVVDVRGSGASYGSRVCEWSPDEIRDGAEIVDWIICQPWSNGAVGAMGISYDGSCAEFLLVNKHPAVKAVAPRFALFDSYTDIAFPGGIHATWFTEHWGRMNDALDRNAPHEAAGWWVKLFVTGVQPVQADRDRSLRAGAVRAHRDNYGVHAQALALTYRDDIAPSDPFHRQGLAVAQLAGHPRDTAGSLGLFSPHNYAGDTEASGAAIYSYSGWLDRAYPHAAIKRYLTIRTPGSRLILGPWNHGGGWDISPPRARKSGFDHAAELLRFFDYHLKGIDTGIEHAKPVRYFTMVEGKWKDADGWPPPATTATYYCAANNLLSRSAPAARDARDEYRVDYTAGTGDASRWRTQAAIDAAVRYPDRQRQDEKLLVYTSPPLDRSIEVTGHPLITLFVSSTSTDGHFFVYLEDVDASGRVSYVTEGQLRAIHRKFSETELARGQVVPNRSFKRADALPLVPDEIAPLVFDLLPTSYLFRQGHAIRIALAGADSSHFAVPPGNPPTIQVYRSTLHPSHIDLPLVGAA